MEALALGCGRLYISHCGLITLPIKHLLKVVWSMDNDSFFFHLMVFHDSFSGAFLVYITVMYIL